jgi:hypothetical protein
VSCFANSGASTVLAKPSNFRRNPLFSFRNVSQSFAKSARFAAHGPASFDAQRSPNSLN